MFYSKYLDDYYLEELFNNYDINYLRSIDYENFIRVYSIFKKYNFYFIEDIIDSYLEIFDMDSKIVENKILELRDKLGDDFVSIIGDDLTYLDSIISK